MTNLFLCVFSTNCYPLESFKIYLRSTYSTVFPTLIPMNSEVDYHLSTLFRKKKTDGLMLLSLVGFFAMLVFCRPQKEVNSKDKLMFALRGRLRGSHNVEVSFFLQIRSCR